MHDGSIATLGEVIEHYARGGRLVRDGPLAGDGRDSPRKSELVRGFDLDAGGKADLVEFLKSLTDRTFAGDPRFAAPAPPAITSCIPGNPAYLESHGPRARNTRPTYPNR